MTDPTPALPSDQRQQVLDALAKLATEPSGLSAPQRIDAANTYLMYSPTPPTPKPATPADVDGMYRDGVEPAEAIADLTMRAMVALALVWDEVPRPPTIQDIVAMTRNELGEIIDWVFAVHLRASDNDDVEVPDMPSFLQLPPTSPTTPIKPRNEKVDHP